MEYSEKEIKTAKNINNLHLDYHFTIEEITYFLNKEKDIYAILASRIDRVYEDLHSYNENITIDAIENDNVNECLKDKEKLQEKIIHPIIEEINEIPDDDNKKELLNKIDDILFLFEKMEEILNKYDNEDFRKEK